MEKKIMLSTFSKAQIMTPDVTTMISSGYRKERCIMTHNSPLPMGGNVLGMGNNFCKISV